MHKRKISQLVFREYLFYFLFLYKTRVRSIFHIAIYTCSDFVFLKADLKKKKIKVSIKYNFYLTKHARNWLY